MTVTKKVKKELFEKRKKTEVFPNSSIISDLPLFLITPKE
jgi:hypothetical protein